MPPNFARCFENTKAASPSPVPARPFCRTSSLALGCIMSATRPGPCRDRRSVEQVRGPEPRGLRGDAELLCQ